MEQQAELKAKKDGLSEDFKRRVVAWEKAGVLDRIVTGRLKCSHQWRVMTCTAADARRSPAI